MIRLTDDSRGACDRISYRQGIRSCKTRRRSLQKVRVKSRKSLECIWAAPRPSRMRLRVEDVLVQRDHVRWGKEEIEILHGLGHKEALHAIIVTAAASDADIVNSRIGNLGGGASEPMRVPKTQGAAPRRVFRIGDRAGLAIELGLGKR